MSARIIHAGRVVLGNGGAIDDATIIVEGGHVAFVGSRATAPSLSAPSSPFPPLCCC